MPPNSLSVFFPVYNEIKNITRVLERALEVVPHLGYDDYEILFVDDGSRDGSDQVIEAWMARDPHIRLVCHGENHGYGAALRTGFTSAKNDLVFYTDSGLPVDLIDLEEALMFAGEADLVIGYRIDRHETLRRAVYSRVYNLLMRLLFGVRVRDVNFSFKLVHRRVLERITLTAETVFIDGQLLAEATRYGFRIQEIPVEYHPRCNGWSNFDSLRVAWDTLSEMLEYWLVRLRQRGEIAHQQRETVDLL